MGSSMRCVSFLASTDLDRPNCVLRDEGGLLNDVVDGVEQRQTFSGTTFVFMMYISLIISRAKISGFTGAGAITGSRGG